MNEETQTHNDKSLRLITGSKAGWVELARDCVCFANAAGDVLRIGIKDGASEPPAEQHIAPAVLDKLRKRLGELTVNVQALPELVRHANGGEYVALHVPRSAGIASTADGRYFTAWGDSCNPVPGDDVMRLLTDRPQMPWEMMRAASSPNADAAKRSALIKMLRALERVKDSVKSKTNAELLAHYGLTNGKSLTQLGVLMLARPVNRARLGSALIVQAIKYDQNGVKESKWTWDDYTPSPLDLPDAIWSTIPDFRESYEVADGMFRRSVSAYDKRVVRELLVNALVHRPYTQRGNILLNVHPDRLEVVSSGPLPIDVASHNILHGRRRRKERMGMLFWRDVGWRCSPQCG